MANLTTYFASSVEHALVFERTNGEMVNLVVHHLGSCNEVSLTVFEDRDASEVRETITISYQEARMLRDLLNRAEVGEILERE